MDSLKCIGHTFSASPPGDTKGLTQPSPRVGGQHIPPVASLQEYERAVREHLICCKILISSLTQEEGKQKQREGERGGELLISWR